MARLFGLKTCDMCRKALKELPDVQHVDVKEDGVPGDLLARAYEQFGDKLLNSQSQTWRGLSESERDQPPLALLAAHPTLMKRPLIESGGALYLGWTPGTRAALGVA